MNASMKISRRKVLAGGAALAAGATFLEYRSLTGHFDHRRFPGETSKARFDASREALRTTNDALVHVGHSTHLLRVGGLTFLTDPWFYDPAFGALSHLAGPAVSPEHVGDLDAVLVSHDHADHADMNAIDRLDKRARAVVATGALAAGFRARGFSEVHVLAPWEELRLGDATVTAVPGLHDIYEIGFVVRGASKCVYFAGDTRLHPDLPAIAERLAPTCAILPVDGTRLTGGAMHVMTPDDAVTAARILRVKLAIPSHGEARFSDPIAETLLASSISNAPARFGDAMRALPNVRCVVPSPGELVPLA
jgi:L-ascorbate metabolism protein UlaG (beta-lactamase superfamily)